MGSSTRWAQVFLQKELVQRKENEKLQLWGKATEPVLERKADDSEHRQSLRLNPGQAPWLRWQTQGGKGVAHKELNTCSFCSFGGRSVDTVEVPPQVEAVAGSSANMDGRVVIWGKISQQGTLP